ncbi:histidine kinase [Marivirga sp. S37H4]|uniref:Histidine kinase n=1 Tax=Marivirga aurantiaca TaxID=2802615 RepID=A0A935CDP1_9BACT|nr:histidine kinase [Marivirga aurantiaca]MBK6267118.1 histidine kinase [Marivirga aurantiaca]
MLKKILFHITYWAFALLLGAFLIAYRSNWQEAIFLTLVFSPIPIGSAYLITHFLLHEYLIKRRYLRFFLYIAYILIVSFFLLLLFNTAIFIFIAEYQFNLMPPATQDLLTLFVTLFLLVILFVATQSIRQWSIVYQEKELALRNASESELRFLKTQLHPHFLFNTLNNLYVLALEKSDKAPELVLKLSSLLDYILASGKNKLVDLSEEIEVMNDFIYLETLRYEDRLTLNKKIDVPVELSIKIPPLILVTIMENCFKHGAMNNWGKVVIEFNMSVKDKMLLIKSSNRFFTKSTSLPTGIGLNNIQKQLNYLYGKNYILQVEKSGNLFNLHLSIPIHATD